MISGVNHEDLPLLKFLVKKSEIRVEPLLSVDQVGDVELGIHTYPCSNEQLPKTALERANQISEASYRTALGVEFAREGRESVHSRYPGLRWFKWPFRRNTPLHDSSLLPTMA
jgi:hypothetical protein